MTQTRLGSLVESVANTLVGLVVAVLATYVITRANDIPMTWEHNFILTFWMTVISVLRSYIIRRCWNSRWWLKLSLRGIRMPVMLRKR